MAFAYPECAIKKAYHYGAGGFISWAVVRNPFEGSRGLFTRIDTRIHFPCRQKKVAVACDVDV